MAELTERQMLVKYICGMIRLTGIEPEAYMEMRERLENTSLAVLRDIGDQSIEWLDEAMARHPLKSMVRKGAA
jgi:hypothetical protein